jgi:hypothetical protein
MKTITCVLAILAAVSTAAVAKDLKQDKKATAPTVAATQMSDAEMDRVTAGQGFGVATASEHTSAVLHSEFGLLTADSHSQGLRGRGLCTAGLAAC